MEDNKNNMEEFFNRSLERFDELPSDDVWANVSDRLTAEEKWYDPILAPLKLVFPILLALLLMGLYHFYTQHNIKQLNQQLTEAETTIQNLKTQHQTTLNNNNKQTTATSIAVLQKNTEIENLRNDYSLLNKSYKQLLSKAATQNTTSSNTNILLDKIQTLQKQLTGLRYILYQKDTELALLRETQTTENQQPENQQKATRKPATRTEVFCSLQHFPHLKPINISLNNSLDSKLALLQSRTPTKGNTISEQQEEEEEEINLTPPKLRIGIKARYFNALVQNSQLVNPGFSNGIRAELRLGHKWAITGDFMYNSQVYTINAGQNTFSKTSLERFPGGIEDNTNVNIISTRTRYFDANPGMKFMPNYAPDKFNFFINPSVVWHLYLPQEYQYDLRQEDNILYKENRIVAYFGSGNLSVGFERRISPKLHFQFNLWGEQSFIPLGYERQYMSRFGISSAILF